MYDELVNALRRLSDWSIMDFEDNLSYANQIAEEAADAIAELSKDLDSMNEANIALYGALPKWIPVTERLPEKYVNVLVFIHSLDWNSIYYSIDHLMEDGQWWKASTSWKHEVTHWMPLPTPPTAEEGK